MAVHFRTKFNGRSIWPDSCFSGVFGWVVAVGLALLTQVARAEDTCPRAEGSSPESNELVCPPVCSPLKPIPPELKDYCKIETEPGTGRHNIKVILKAHTDQIEVGGYKVTTEHYNDSYLTPVIEALPGDTVLAHLVNSLTPPAKDGTQTMAHEAAGVIPTNLHYFHGGIVTPNNARQPTEKDARTGDGDNIYVWLKNGTDSNSFEFKVPIAGVDKLGVGELDARVLESKGMIPHPPGLNWYHSHLHGISSTQVMGGMSGLLSVGKDKENVYTQCKPGTPPDKCKQDIKQDTDELRERTIVRYAMLRDISLMKLNASPIEDTKTKKAYWDPEKVNFRPKFDPKDVCKVWKKKDSTEEGSSEKELREGFCQRDPTRAWLFTLNGQRFPTITVADGKNLLLRLGNLSANVAYWLELVKIENENKETKIPLTVLSLDGVVPAKPEPEDSTHPKIPVDAVVVPNLLLMPASRVEIYIRNDSEEHPKEVYILRTKGLNTGSDEWPEIQLAQMKLEASTPKRSIALALNVPTAEIPAAFFTSGELQGPKAALPKGCVRDLDPKNGEHRRVLFRGATASEPGDFAITTKIVKKPPGDEKTSKEEDFKSDDDILPNLPDDEKTTVSASFEQYEQGHDGSINWEGDGTVEHPKHVCIHLNHEGSHKQLWVLTNDTGQLHNFHIHQMKFRLATLKDLDEHHITPPGDSHTCTPESKCTCTPDAGCTAPDYKLYDDNPNPKTIWHDTIPVPPGRPVFIIMSFDAPQQVGRFVYHCHILKHEDVGLMAPIEVWKDAPADFDFFR